MIPRGSMSTRTWMTLIAIFGTGLGLPLLVAYQLRLGEFAKSPQNVHLNLGGSVFVAGGRARLWFAEIGMGPTVEISCKKESAMVDLADGEASEEVCGIQVRKLELGELEFKGHAIPRVELEVTWKDE